MSFNDIERARLLEHAVESAVGGLSREEWLELRRQVGTAALDQDDGLERAAAAIELARQPRLEPMPRHLAAAVATDADRFFAPRRVAPRAARAEPRPAWFAYGGWIAAAASLVAAIGILWSDRMLESRAVAALEQPAEVVVDDEASSTATGPADDPEASGVAGRAGGERRIAEVAGAPAGREPAEATLERQALAAQPFVLRRNWSPGGDPAGREVSGDVVWDARTQSGFLRFVGLPRNDRSREQYQLWIFDARRDARYPVDGGVFDVEGDGEAVIPIRARLPVGAPQMFAVTLERPGGVVVSDRSRLVVLARIG